MPLQYQTINIPFGFGMDESHHPFTLPRPLCEAVVNGRVDKTGAISKRLGWAEVSSYVGNPGGRILTLPDGRMFVLNRNTNVSNPVRLSQFGGVTSVTSAQTGAGGTQALSEIFVTGREEVAHDTARQIDGSGFPVLSKPDMGYEPTSNLVVYCWVQAGNDATTRVFATVLNASTRVQVVPARDVSVTAESPGHGQGQNAVRPRVVRQGTSLYVVYGRPDTVSPTTASSIWAAKFDTVTLGWSNAVQLVNDWDGGTFDVHEFVGSESTAWFLAYSRATATRIALRKVNGTTVIAIVDTGAVVTSVQALCIYAELGGSVWIAYWDSTPRVAYMGFDTGLVGVTFGPTAIETGATIEQLLMIGITKGNGTDTVAVFWSTCAYLAFAAFPGFRPARPVSKFCRVTSGGAVSGIAQRTGFAMCTRPYLAANDVYYCNYVYDAGMCAHTVPAPFKASEFRSRGYCTGYTVAVASKNTLLFSTVLNAENPELWRAAATWAIGEASSRNVTDEYTGVRFEVGANAGFGASGDVLFSQASGAQLEFALQTYIENGVADSDLAVIAGRYGVSACRMIIDRKNEVPVYAALIGNNVVFSGGTPSVFDGQNVVEYGFLWPPENAAGEPTHGGGDLEAGQYLAKVTWRYKHATGDVTESIPVQVREKETGAAELTVAAAGDHIALAIPVLGLTKKYNDVIINVFGGSQEPETILAPVVQVYRTEADSGTYYSEGENTVTGSTANKIYDVQGDLFPTVQVADDFALAQPQLYNTDGILDNYPPPALTHIVTHRGRVFGISAENPRKLRFTHIYEPGELPGWNPLLELEVPEKAFALASLDDKLVIFCEKSVFFLMGNGPDKKGLNSDYSEPERLNAPYGTTNPDTLAQTPDGIFFGTNEGGGIGPISIYMIDRKLSVQRVGGPVEDSITDMLYCTGSIVDHVNERIYWCYINAPLMQTADEGIVAVYDWRHNAWMIDAVQAGQEEGPPVDTQIVSLGNWGGFLYATTKDTTRLYIHAGYSDPGGDTYIPTIIATAWLPLAQTQAWQRYRWLGFLADRIAAHDLAVAIYNDYQATAVQTWTWTDGADISNLSYEHLKMHISNQRATAVRVAFADSQSAGEPVGAGYTVTGLALECGMKAPLVKLPQGGMKG